MEKLGIRDIAEMTGLHTNTIRRYADRGYIESKRDFRGWRHFPEPIKTIQKINAMLSGDLMLDKK